MCLYICLLYLYLYICFSLAINTVLCCNKAPLALHLTIAPSYKTCLVYTTYPCSTKCNICICIFSIFVFSVSINTVPGCNKAPLAMQLNIAPRCNTFFYNIPLLNWVQHWYFYLYICIFIVNKHSFNCNAALTFAPFLQPALAQPSAAEAAQQQNKLKGKVNPEKYWQNLHITKYLQQILN